MRFFQVTGQSMRLQCSQNPEDYFLTLNKHRKRSCTKQLSKIHTEFIVLHEKNAYTGRYSGLSVNPTTTHALGGRHEIRNS